MFRETWIAALAVLGLLAAPVAATADEVSGSDDMQEQLWMMQKRLKKMEDQLAATNRQLADARAAAPAAGEMGPMLQFLNSLEFGGWISGSYFYNFSRNIDGRDQVGSLQGGDPTGGDAFIGFYPTHPDTNSFSLDQVWFEMEKPVSEDSRAGFRLDFVYGKTAEILSVQFTDFSSGSSNDFNLYQGYVQWLAPLGNGVTFKAGKFATLIGAEVIPTVYNYNITRGNVFNLMQPINHVGVLASSELMAGTSLTVGFVNETRSNTDVDVNTNKAVLWSLAWENEQFGASFNGTFGASDSGQSRVNATVDRTFVDTPASDRELILDFIGSWTPNDQFSGYVNLDYIDSQNSNSIVTSLASTGRVKGWGISAAGRYALNEKLGLAGRAEWVDLDYDVVGLGEPDLKVWGLTGTVDYMLATNLQIKGELRYDRANEGDIKTPFISSGGSTRGELGSGQSTDKKDQFVGGVEVIYSF